MRAAGRWVVNQENSYRQFGWWFPGCDLEQDDCDREDDDPDEAKRQSPGLPVRLMQHREKSAAGLEIPCPPGSALSQTEH
jgi:hypothetical protein